MKLRRHGLVANVRMKQCRRNDPTRQGRLAPCRLERLVGYAQTNVETICQLSRLPCAPESKTLPSATRTAKNYHPLSNAHAVMPQP